MTEIRLNLVFILIVALAITLISSGFKSITFADRADEGLYLNYSTMVADRGIKGFRDLFSEYFSQPSHRITQNPLRAGFIIVSSFWIKLLGYSMYSLAYLSLFTYFLLLILVFYFAKKYLDKGLALLFVILVAFSPINMAMARRALVDSTLNLFMFASVLLFFENLKAKNKLRDLLFVLIYSFTILIKEGSILLSLFFIFYIVITRKKNPAYFTARGLLITAIAPISIAGIIYIILAGGVLTFYKTAISVATSPAINAYAIFYCSGPWFRYLLDFMLLSPWTFVLAVGFVFYYLSKSGKKDILNYLLLFSLAMLFFYAPLIKNIRYLMIVDLPLRLFALLMLYELLGLIAKQRVLFWLTLAVLTIACFDYLRFHYFFVYSRIYDPVSLWLLQASHIIPWK